jgi:putative ABC transport system permease protein
MRDLHYALRTLFRTPSVTGAAIVALALGIGANAAIFSVVYAALLRPLPIRDAGRVAAIHAYNAKFNIPPIQPGYSVYGVWRQQVRSFESLAASWSGVADLDTDTVPHWRVSATFFPTLGVQPALGRAFTTADDQPGAPRVAILAHSFWTRRFHRDPAIAGQTLKLNGEIYTIVGVAPRGFQIDGKPAEIYTPITQDPADRRRYLPVTVYARLRPGVSLAQAQSEMDAIEAARDTRGSGWKARVWSLRESMVRDLRLSLLVLLGAVGMVLLIACANVASLLLARAGARRQEAAIRTALGASRGRLVRQFLTESLLLGLMGGAAGLLVAAFAMRLVPSLDSERLPNLLLATRIDGGVLSFTLLVSLATGAIFGVAPALSAAPRLEGRGGDARRSRRLWKALIVSETALALVLMIGATGLIRSFFYLRDTAPGFRPDGLLTVNLTPPRGQDPLPFYQRALETARAVPGVRSATLATTLPLDGNYASMSLPIEGRQFARPQDMPILWHRSVEAEYFRTLEIPLRRGRCFTAQDRAGVIVNETMARRFWPAQDAIGKHVGPHEILGVIADVRIHNATEDGLLEVIFPYLQTPPGSMTLAVRAPRSTAPALARALASPKVGDMLAVVSERIIHKQLTAGVIGIFASLALVLAAVGIYGVLSFTVACRTQEIGVRMALGAERGAVVRMVAREAAVLALIGIAIGLIAARALSRVLASLIYGASPTDPSVFAGASAFLFAVAVLAAWLPARRAAAVDPATALRSL